MAHDDLVALAATLTGLLAFPLAILTFFAERLIAKRPADSRYVAYLGGLFVAASYTATCAAVAWWAWLEAIPRDVELLLGLTRAWFLAAVFAPPAVFGVIGAMVATWALIRRGWRRLFPSPA